MAPADVPQPPQRDMRGPADAGRRGVAPGTDEPPRRRPLAGLDPEHLFDNVPGPVDVETMQWLAHVQRLASTGLLVGGMAHDLAGLLQPLLGEAERVLLKDDPAEYREALVKVREWARRSQEYVRALLDLLRRHERHRAVVSVESVVEDTLSLLESTKKMAGVSISRKLDNSHDALVDRTRLMQAVVNLVTNAVRAAREGGHEVDVTVRGWREWVVIEVKDNGPGVAAEIEDRIFEPFVGAHERDRGGTGLGLYITKRLIEEQGGRVEFKTKRGFGTTFRLLLEAAGETGRSAPASKDTSAPATDAKGNE